MQIYVRPAPFQVLSFDLDDTLYDNRPAIATAERELLQHVHQQHPQTVSWQRQDWRAQKLKVLQRNPKLAHDPSAARLEVLTQGFKHLGLGNKAISAAKDAFDCFYFHRSNFTVETSVLTLLAELGQRYRLIGVTNGNVEAERIGLTPALELVLRAGNGLRMKPYADMFVEASQHLQINLNQVMHIGDSLGSDVAGARLAGCQATWLSPGYGRDQPEADWMANNKHPMLPQVSIQHITELRHF